MEGENVEWCGIKNDSCGKHSPLAGNVRWYYLTDLTLLKSSHHQDSSCRSHLLSKFSTGFLATLILNMSAGSQEAYSLSRDRRLLFLTFVFLKKFYRDRRECGEGRKTREEGRWREGDSGERSDYPSANFLPRWLHYLGLGWVKARSQMRLLGLPCECQRLKYLSHLFCLFQVNSSKLD